MFADKIDARSVRTLWVHCQADKFMVAAETPKSFSRMSESDIDEHVSEMAASFTAQAKATFPARTVPCLLTCSGDRLRYPSWNAAFIAAFGGPVRDGRTTKFLRWHDEEDREAQLTMELEKPAAMANPVNGRKRQSKKCESADDVRFHASSSL